MAGKEAKIEHQGEDPGDDANAVRDLTLVERLVAGGASRLTAERMVAIERGEAEPGRARRHAQARR
jgi:hypothetical protein